MYINDILENMECVGYLIVETLKLNKIQRHRMQDLAVQRTGVLKDAGAARRL